MSPASAARRRLSRAAEFDAVYRRGRSAASRHLVAYVFPREASDREPPRLGVSVSRRVGGAVERNRVKRVLREGFAQLAATPRLRGVDVVLVARPGLAEAIEARGSGWLSQEVAALVGQAREQAA